MACLGMQGWVLVSERECICLQLVFDKQRRVCDPADSTACILCTSSYVIGAQPYQTQSQLLLSS